MRKYFRDIVISTRNGSKVYLGRILAGAMLLSIAFLLFYPSCQSNKREALTIGDLISDDCSLEKEIQKDFMAIKIIKVVHSNNVKVVDAFGNELTEGSWYVRSNITYVVFPLKSQRYDNIGIVGQLQLEHLTFPLSDQCKKEKARVKINDGTPMGAYVDAEILLLKEGILVLNNTYMSQEVYVKWK